MRSILIAAGLAVLLIAIGGVAVSGQPLDTHTIPIVFEPWTVTTVYTVTNASALTATYTQEFYTRLGDEGDAEFPYRLVFETGGVLDPGASATYTAGQFAEDWTEPADTLIIRSDAQLTVTHAIRTAAPDYPLYLPVILR